MSRYFVLLRDWKINVKTVIGIVCMLCIIFMLPGPVASQYQISLSEPWAPAIEEIPSSDRPIQLQTGDKQKFTIMAEKMTKVAKTTRINYIEFTTMELEGKPKPKKHGWWGSKPLKECGILSNCKKLEHSITYSWSEPGVYKVSAKVGFKFQSNALWDANDVRERVWTVEVISTEPPEPVELPDPPSIRISPSIKDSYTLIQGLNPMKWYKYVNDSYYILVGESMEFRIQAISKDGIASITFTDNEHRPVRMDQFDKPKSRSFLWNPPSSTVVYRWESAGTKKVTAKVVTELGALEEVEWTIEVGNPRPADLVVKFPAVNKSTLTPGGNFKLSATVRNQGTEKLGSISLSYYRSSDTNISRDDTKVGTDGVKDLDGGRTRKHSINLKAPDSPGTYYYYACVYSIWEQSNKDNNCSEVIAITVPAPHLPDLIVESISASKVSLDPGEEFTLYARVRNQGTSKSYSTWLRYHGPGGHEIGKNRVDRLSSTVVSNQNIDLEAPDEVGTYYYEACVDGVSNESEVYNNCSTRIAITVGQTAQNRSPSAVGRTPVQMLTANTAARHVDVSIYFHDPDGDRLTYTARSDNMNVATASASGDEVRITPRVAGSATVTVTASDGSFTATQRFSVTVRAVPVRNQAPVAVGIIPVQSMTVGAAGAVQVSGYFSDSNGDSLTYTARSNNTNVATTWVSGAYLTITPVRVGSATVTVTASDGSFTATQRFSVTVRAVPVRNQAPVAVGIIPVQSMTVGAAGAVQVSGYFSDSNGDSLTYTARSNNTNVATTWVSGAYLTITPVRVGSATVTVTASDGALSATQRFSVTVRVAPVRNQAPVAVGTIPAQSMTVGAAGAVQVSGYFSDSNGDSLTYTAVSGNTNVVTTRVSGAYLTITPVRVGRATVTVSASDGALSATQRFSVTVSAVPVRNQAPAAIGTIAPQTLMVNSAALRVNVSSYFRDSDDDNLTYTANSDNTNVATVSVSGAQITITPQRTGSTTIHVTASDGALSTTQSISVTVASTPPQPDPTSFDLAIQSVTVNKDTLVPGESFTLSVAIRNNGPGTSGAPSLSYYHSSIQGRSPTDPPQLQGEVWLDSLASGESITKVITLSAPSTPRSYYYGAWLSANNGDTNLFNDVATEIGVTVRTVQSDTPDLIVESISASESTIEPGESFRLSATVRNQGSGEARSTTLRYYRSANASISDSDTEVDTDSVSSLDADETSDEWDNLTAPNSPGTYYFGACVDSVSGESNTSNNCSTAVRITVETSSSDLVVESISASESTVEPGESFRLSATVRNQGSGEARSTTLRYYRSSNSSISASDTEVDTDSVSSLDADETSDEWDSLTAPSTAGVYYYGACVDSVSGESNTSNNCSTAIRITVEAPGLRVGDSVFAQNTVGGGFNGLRVRSGAGTGFDIIGGVWDDATGTITDGPGTANGYTWWKVRWNLSNKIACDVNPCEGWSVEIFNGARIIAKQGLASPTLNPMIPTETVLLSNYPNPFNPETWIPYQLSESADVTVSIYSVNGSLIRTLALGHQAAGLYRSRSRAAYWDGRNAFGERVASGLYFYTLTAGDFTATRKMLIRK